MLPSNTIDLLPQKSPFVMVDTLYEVNEGHVKTKFTIPESNPLVFQEYFTEGGLIENMAQSAAAGTGYYYSSINQKIPVGYIGAVKNVAIIALPKAGMQIETELETLNQIGNAKIVAGKIFLNKVLIASCELTIFVTE